MFKFIEKNGISLYSDKKEVLKNITPWINPTLFKYQMPNTKDKKFLNFVSLTDTEAIFTAENNSITMKLTLIEEGDCFAVKLTGKYDSVTAWGWGTHLDMFIGLGFDFDIQHTGNIVDCAMWGLYWQKPFIVKKTADIKPRTQALFAKQRDNALYLLSACDKAFKTEINPVDKRLSLTAHSNTVLDEIDEIVLIGGNDKDVYSLPEKVTSFGLKAMQKAGKLRRDKKYPEIFEYLGWCSWDAFHMDVTEQNLVDKSQEFKDKEIPVRWMIIDDMWGDVNAIDRPTMHSREINSWEADPVRFPGGLKRAVERVNELGIKVGIWHPTSGYWAGINPNGSLAREHGDLLEYSIPAPQSFYGDGTRLLHSFEKKKCEKYYDLQHKFYKECGIEFTKVDNQGSTERFTHMKGSICECTSNLHNAIEKAAKKYYGGALINCMGMPIENFWNRTYSAVNRFSGDFQPENRKWFVQHLLQCSYNSLTQGTVYFGDWDMWWSDDDQAKKNAVLRSMSGGPIYMSDELNRSIKSVIMPTVFADGKIIRLPKPAIPTYDCMFEDSEHNKKIYKVFNTCKNAGVLACFNLDCDENPVSGTVSPADIGGLKKGKYAVYDWFNGTVQTVEYNEAISLELNNYDDFRLLLFVPIINGRAVIGLKEKYMSVATVKCTSNSVTPLDDGTLVVYSEEALPSFEKIGDKLFAIKAVKNEKISL